MRDWESAASRLQTGETAVLGEGEPASAGARRIEAAFTPYFEARQRFRLDPAGRAPPHTHWSEDRDGGEWSVAQMLVDPADCNDWEAQFVVSLAGSRAEHRAVVRFITVRPVGTIT